MYIQVHEGFLCCALFSKIIINVKINNNLYIYKYRIQIKHILIYL